ncbi:phosphate system positive regulatory protein pho81, partial [Ascosphaera atra]
HTLTFLAHRKFGKQIQRRSLDLPEYSASFTNYKALKKVPSLSPPCSPYGYTYHYILTIHQVIKQLSVPEQPAQAQRRLQSLSISSTGGPPKTPSFDSQSSYRAKKDVFFFRLVRCAVYETWSIDCLLTL